MPPPINFYAALPVLADLATAMRPHARVPVPPDWYVALTDVVDSTRAIAEDRYKEVNIAGGLAVMALANLRGDLDFPYVFGGDGIVALVPPHLHDAAHDVLADTRARVADHFGLELRVALVPVADLYAEDLPFRVARYRVSEYYVQSVFTGAGVRAAEAWLKDSNRHPTYEVGAPHDPDRRADFEGFTCRWQDIPSHRGETITTIIQIRETYPADRLGIILRRMGEIFGEATTYHPVHPDQLRITHRGYDLRLEALVRTGLPKGRAFRRSLRWRRFNALVADFAMRFKMRWQHGWYQLDRLKDYQIASSDFQKFDGSFKIVLAGDATQRAAWAAYLDDLYRAGRIYYGLHVSNRALMTCLMHAGSEREVHFIDGADGGYALAAKMLKAQRATATGSA